MIPLQPPARTAGPTYPTRASLLGDPALRRRALSVLAVAVLSGCGAVPPEPPRTGGTPPPPVVPTATPTPMPGLIAPPQPPPTQQPIPQPNQLAGDMVAPPPPQPQALRGESSDITPPAPEPLRGKIRCEQPLPAPVTP